MTIKLIDLLINAKISNLGIKINVRGNAGVKSCK